MRKSTAPIFPLLLAALGAFLLSSCGSNKDVQASASAASEIPTVAVAKVATADLSRDLILTAEFKPFQEVDVMAKVSGYVKEIRVDVGDRVKDGDLLATLEVPEMADDLRKSQAGVRHSQSEVARAEDEIARAKSAHDIAHLSYNRLFQASQKIPGLIAQQEIDDAQSKDLVAEAQLAAANSALAAAGQQVDVDQSSTARVQTMIDYERVTAPFTGVVTKRYADKGSMIQAGTASQTQAMPVVRLSENGLLRLILPVPGIRRPHRPHRPAGGGARAHPEPHVPRQSGPLLRQGVLPDPHHGYRSRRAQPQPGADPRHVRRSQPHPGPPRCRDCRSSHGH